jgi:hypothetical protein
VIGTEGSIRQEGLLQPKGYLERFMLRALGMAAGDEALIRGADRKFRALRLDWHLSQTRVLRDLRLRN